MNVEIGQKTEDVWAEQNGVRMLVFLNFVQEKLINEDKVV